MSKAVTINDVAYPNVAGFEKLMGNRAVKDISGCSTEPGTYDGGIETDDGVMQACNALTQQMSDVGDTSPITLQTSLCVSPVASNATLLQIVRFQTDTRGSIKSG